MNPLQLCSQEKWLMEPTRCLALHRRLAQIRELPTAVELAEHRQAATAATRSIRPAQGGIAVVEIMGFIEQRTSILGFLFGGFAIEDGSRLLRQLRDARDVSQVVLQIDSGGGTTYGVQEFADQVFEFRKTKPLHTVIDSVGGSAAYWIGSAANTVTVTPGGDVGSIGVYAVHEDLSGALDQDGIRISVVQAGKYKAELSPYQPLSNEARDYLQEQIDYTYSQFVRSVARNRETTVADVIQNFGEGRIVNAERALAVGMADSIAPFDVALAKLTGARQDLQRMREAHAARKHEQNRLDGDLLRVERLEKDREFASYLSAAAQDRWTDDDDD